MGTRLEVIALFLMILSPTVHLAASQSPSFLEHPIENNFQGMACAVIFDLDRDGDLDIIGGSEWTPTSESIGIAWWRNNGGDSITWTRFPVDAAFNNVMSVEVAYIDTDTFPDIVATSWSLDQIAWWKNSGDPTTGWEKRLIRTSFTNAHDAECCDMNNDGFTDVVGVNSTPGSVIVLYHRGNTYPGWNAQILSSTFSGGKSVEIIDFDHDDDPDIIGTAADANQITWWENTGGNPVVWTSHVITSNLPGSHDIDVVDLNGDSLYDVIATGWLGDEVSYYICNDLDADLWTKTLITDQLEIAVKALGRDFDRDGDVDIVAVGKIPGELILFENDNLSWTPTRLKQNYSGGWALAGDDLDGDGDLDFISGASTLGTLSFWENTSQIVFMLITSFTAESTESGVKIRWTIVPDEKIRGFRIYKCEDGSERYLPTEGGRLIPADRTSHLDTEVQSGHSYSYYLTVVMIDGSETISATVTVKLARPELILNQNYPNPFNSRTVISFNLPESNHATLAVYGIDGRKIITLIDVVRSGGYNQTVWDGRDSNGRPLSSGIYLYRFEAGGRTLTRKMVLLK